MLPEARTLTKMRNLTLSAELYIFFFSFHDFQLICVQSCDYINLVIIITSCIMETDVFLS
jgi:hypothetical protein